MGDWDKLQVPKIPKEDCACDESIVAIGIAIETRVGLANMAKEECWIAVEDHWRRGAVEMLFEEVQSMLTDSQYQVKGSSDEGLISEHHVMDEVLELLNMTQLGQFVQLKSEE